MNILAPLYDGFEEIEFVNIVDILRRAKLNVIIAGKGESAKGAHNIIIKIEKQISQIEHKNVDAIVLAGGYEGMLNLCGDKKIIQLIQDLNKENKLIAAICAAPIVLGNAGVLKNKFTCYPSCEANVAGSAEYIDSVICKDENILTSIGPASATLFALEIVKILTPSEIYNNLKEELLFSRVYE